MALELFKIYWTANWLHWLQLKIFDENFILLINTEFSLVILVNPSII